MTSSTSSIRYERGQKTGRPLEGLIRIVSSTAIALHPLPRPFPSQKRLLESKTRGTSVRGITPKPRSRELQHPAPLPRFPAHLADGLRSGAVQLPPVEKFGASVRLHCRLTGDLCRLLSAGLLKPKHLSTTAARASYFARVTTRNKLISTTNTQADNFFLAPIARNYDASHERFIDEVSMESDHLIQHMYNRRRIRVCGRRTSGDECGIPPPPRER